MKNPEQSDPSEKKGNISKFFRLLEGFDWTGISPVEYKSVGTDSWRGVSRRVFVGERGESTHFHLRYFEVEPGGYTSLEEHDHEHCVLCLRGQGLALVGSERLAMRFGDVLYVAPRDRHQFRNDSDCEPFGFVCVVNAVRDRPRLLQGPISE